MDGCFFIIKKKRGIDDEGVMEFYAGGVSRYRWMAWLVSGRL